MLDEIQAEYKEKVKCVKLNTDESPQVATDFGIRSIPTVRRSPQRGVGAVGCVGVGGGGGIRQERAPKTGWCAAGKAAHKAGGGTTRHVGGVLGWGSVVTRVGDGDGWWTRLAVSVQRSAHCMQQVHCACCACAAKCTLHAVKCTVHWAGEVLCVCTVSGTVCARNKALQTCWGGVYQPSTTCLRERDALNTHSTHLQQRCGIAAPLWCRGCTPPRRWRRCVCCACSAHLLALEGRACGCRKASLPATHTLHLRTHTTRPTPLSHPLQCYQRL